MTPVSDPPSYAQLVRTFLRIFLGALLALVRFRFGAVWIVAAGLAAGGLHLFLAAGDVHVSLAASALHTFAGP